jgi:hypothetical protein
LSPRRSSPIYSLSIVRVTTIVRRSSVPTDELQHKSNIYELGHIYCHQSAGIQTSSGDRILGKEQSIRNREIRSNTENRVGFRVLFIYILRYQITRAQTPRRCLPTANPRPAYNRCLPTDVMSTQPTHRASISHVGLLLPDMQQCHSASLNIFLFLLASQEL